MLIFALGSEDDRGEVEKALGVRFELHDSLYRGGDYWLARVQGSRDELRILRNVDLMWSPGDPDAERFRYSKYADHELLLEVDSPALEIRNQLLRIPSLKLLSPDPGTEGSG